MDGLVMMADVEAGFQHQSNSELADGVAAVVGHVAHGNAPLLGGSQVHHIETSGQYGNHFHIGTFFQGGLGNGGFVHHHDLRVTNALSNEGRFLIGSAVINRYLAQRFQRGPAQVAGILGIAVQYYDFHNSNLLYKIEFHLLKYRWTQGKKCGIMEPINQGGRPCLKPHLPGLHPINPRKKRSPFWNCFQRRRDLCACGTSVPLWD